MELSPERFRLHVFDEEMRQMKSMKRGRKGTRGRERGMMRLRDKIRERDEEDRVDEFKKGLGGGNEELG